MEVITSNKGGQKLCFGGYMYVVHKRCANNIRWRCNKYTSLKCIQGMKVRARDTLAKPIQIYAEAVQQLPNSTRAVLPTEDAIKRTLRNHKGAKFPDPQSLQELLIEGDWRTTGEPNNERFLLHDNGPNSDERVIIFATDGCLVHLANSTAWFVDGNFSLAPNLFLQLYVVRVKIQGLFVTCAYSLLQRKTQTSYEIMLRALVSSCEERNLFPDPLSINMDFERAAIQAFQAVFGDHITIRGCFYHLCQSTQRKLQELGLQRRYREDEDFSNFCGMLDGLAFLPLEDVARGMEFLRQNIPEGAEDLVEYFDATYVSGTNRRVGNVNDDNVRIRNVPPVFPPPCWNVHNTTLQDDERTNNHTEGWNHRFSTLVGQNHPTVWVLIQKMRQELSTDETKVQQRQIGRQMPKKKKPAYVVMQARLKLLCEEYRDGVRNLVDFLNAVSHNIRF
ncbi:hypothetical protein PPYR_02356 [Photinus pyralis]|uniref:MULE transposase domain-containing protein n=1 Tax=Photinus pyralis TaxID=7054 RepID=A0A5N4B742_PHOPY|nr:hypothetical protein PPYR_02356 [Photinus pyralis]